MTLLTQQKEKRKKKYVAWPGIEPRTSDLRARCPTDCATQPDRSYKCGLKYQTTWQCRSYKCGVQIPEYMTMQILQVWPEIPDCMAMQILQAWQPNTRIHSNADPTSVATKYQNTWRCRSCKCGNQIPEYMAMQILQVWPEIPDCMAMQILQAWQPNTRIHSNADPTSVATKYQNTWQCRSCKWCLKIPEYIAMQIL